MQKIKRAAIALLGLVTLAACSGGDEISNRYVTCETYPSEFDRSNLVPKPVKVLSQSGSRWVIMGSSSAAGAGAEGYRYSWAGQLEHDLTTNGHELANIAKGGYVTYQALPSECHIDSARPASDPEHNVDRALQLNPDVVVVSFPSNDAAVGYSANESAANMLLMRDALAQHGIAMVVISSQPRPLIYTRHRRLQKLDTLLRPAFGACYIDVFEALDDGSGELAKEFDYDTVHLNRAGHSVVYEAIIEMIESQQCVLIAHD